jgi:hypothetical protein
MMLLNSFKEISPAAYECTRSDFITKHQAKRGPKIADVDTEFSTVVSWGVFLEIELGSRLFDLVPFVRVVDTKIATALALLLRQPSALGLGIVILSEGILMTRMSSRY